MAHASGHCKCTVYSLLPDLLLWYVVFLVHVEALLDTLDCLCCSHDLINLYLLVLILLVVLEESGQNTDMLTYSAADGI